MSAALQLLRFCSIYTMASPTYTKSFQFHHPKPSASARSWHSRADLHLVHTYSPTPTQAKINTGQERKKKIKKRTTKSHRQYGQFRFYLLKTTSLDHHFPAWVFQVGQLSTSCSQIKAARLSDTLSDRWSLWDLQVLSTWNCSSFKYICIYKYTHKYIYLNINIYLKLSNVRSLHLKIQTPSFIAPHN